MGWNGNAGFKFGLGENPKDLAGRAKVSLSKLPAVASAHAAHAMMDGAKKYDPYNWRKNRVLASIYIDAAQRHLLAWFEGEENAPDSEAHHLGHAIACCGILLDAQETGNLVDDRPDGKAVMSRVLDRLAEIIRRKSASADDAPITGSEAHKLAEQAYACRNMTHRNDCPMSLTSQWAKHGVVVGPCTCRVAPQADCQASAAKRMAAGVANSTIGVWSCCKRPSPGPHAKGCFDSTRTAAENDICTIHQDRMLAGVKNIDPGALEGTWIDWPASWPPPKDAA